MLALSVKGLEQAIRDVERLQSDLRFTAARALTRSAKDVAAKVTTQIPQYVDRPVPFTTRAVGYQWATKETLRARVFIKDIQAAYLGFTVFGGTRTPKKRAVVVPTEDAALNVYGNLPRGYVKRLLKGGNTFSGRPRSGRSGDRFHGSAGIWLRADRRKLVQLIAYKPRVEYKSQFPFHDLGERAFDQVWQKHLVEAVDDILLKR